MTKLEEKFLAVLRLEEHFGYEPVPDFEGDFDKYYCRGPQCGQPFGMPHLDTCPVGAFEEEVNR